MKVLMYHGPRNMRIEDVSEVMPANNEVKIKVLYSSICGSDVHGYTGASGRRIPPMYMGHEMSGEVYAIGEEVKGISVGQRVTVQPITFCGKCPMCLAGKVNICENRRGLGVMNVNGTFAEYICVDQSQVFPFSEKLDPVVASLIEPTAVTYHAVKKLLPVKGKSVLVAGAGVIGILTVKWLKYFGADKIIVTGLSDAKLKVALDSGADVAVNPSTQSLSDSLIAAGMPQGVDKAIECVGATPTCAQTIDHVRVGGQVVWLGNAAKNVTIDMQKIVTTEVNVQGTYGFTRGDFEEALHIVEKGGIQIADLVSSVIPFESAVDAFEQLAADPDSALKIVVKISH